MARPLDENDIVIQVRFITQMLRDPASYRRNGKLMRNTLSRIKESCLIIYHLLERQIEDRNNSEETHTNDLQSIYESYKQSYVTAAQCVVEWGENRRNFMEKLNELIEDSDKQFKMFSYLKLFSSSIEVSGTIIGELLFGSDSGWDKKALEVAYNFGCCGMLCSMFELHRTKQILTWAYEFIQKDRSQLEPFVQWFRDQDLDNVVQNMFSQSIDMVIVRQIQETQNQESDRTNIFMSALITDLKGTRNVPQNHNFLFGLYQFATSDLALMWWYKISQRRRDFIENFNSSITIIGDSVGQMKSVLAQGIPDFILEQQRLTNIPVQNRIMLNLISIFHSCMDLKHGCKSEISARLRRLRSNMADEWSDLEATVTLMADCLGIN